MRAASKFLLLTVVVAACVSPTAAQYTTPIAQSARSGALGGGFFYCPADWVAMLDYRCAYLLPALADKSVGVQLPVGAGTAVAAYSHHGDAAWHEQQVLLGYSLQATPWLHVGVAARGLHRGTGDAHYEARRWLAPSALVQASLRHATLTLVGGTRPWDDRHPWRMHLQAAYRPTGQWLTLAEVEREERTRLRLGVEYVYDGWCALRAGLATVPVVLTAGVGFRTGHYSFDLAVGMHSALGVTPQTSLSLWF